MGVKKTEFFKQLQGFTLSVVSKFSILFGTSEWSVSEIFNILSRCFPLGFSSLNAPSCVYIFPTNLFCLSLNTLLAFESSFHFYLTVIYVAVHCDWPCNSHPDLLPWDTESAGPSGLLSDTSPNLFASSKYSWKLEGTREIMRWAQSTQDL